MKKLVLSTAVSMLVSASAYAGPFFIDTGFDFAGNGSTRTSDLAELGYTGTLATSIYFGDPTTEGVFVNVIDTNIQSVKDSYGFNTLAGDNGFQYANPDQRNVDALNAALGTTLDGNGFVNDPTLYGFMGSDLWGITYDYVLFGQGNVVDGALFGAGYFDIFFEDGTDRIQVGRLNVLGSTADAGSSFKYTIDGAVTYDWTGDGIDDTTTDFQRNFFNDSLSGKSFYELWLDGQVNPLNLAVQFELDTNIDAGGTAPLNNLGGVQQVAGTDFYIRQTRLDGSIVFDVPEPFSLALVGLGLLGLGVSRRVKK